MEDDDLRACARTPPRAGKRAAPSQNVPTSPMRRRLLQSALAGAVGFSWAGRSAADDSSAVDYTATLREGRTAIKQAMADSETSSVSVALADRHHIIWQQAFGTIDSAGHPADIDTLYNIGSVSKVLVTVAVMILVDRGQVDLDSPVARILQDFRMLSPQYADVTVRMLLSHCSGFAGANYNNIFTFEAVPGYARKTQSVLAGEHLKHSPGELAVYCNDGFTMAERVVEEVSGKAYAAFVRQEILAPLGMRLSRYPLAGYPEGSFAHPYSEGKMQGQEFVNAYGTGGLSSTPTDMMHLAMMFMNGGEYEGHRLLSRAAVQEMGTDQTTQLTYNPSPVWKWGLGWDLVDHPALREVGFVCWWKNGGTSFFGSDFFVVPDAGLSVMITGTSSAYGSGALAERILLHALIDMHRLPALPQKLSQEPASAAAPNGADQDAVQGYYASFEGVSKVVPNDDGSLDISLYVDGAWTTVAQNLTLRTDGWFAAEGSPRAFRVADIGPRHYLMTRSIGGYGHYWGYMPYAQRVSAEAPMSPAWRARLGKNWVLVNEHESSTMLASESPRVTLREIPGLAGYVQLDGRQPLLPDTDLRTRQFLKIPVNMGRDSYELVVQPKSTEEWLAYGGFRYRPLDSLPAVSAGTHTVQFDAEGNSQCLRLTHCRTIQVAGARAWRLYDDQWTTIEFMEGAGSASCSPEKPYYLMLYGEPTRQAQLVLA